jgi:hypothetical protein
MGDDESVHKAFRAQEYAPEPGPGREPSPEEEAGMPDTDPAPQPPLGVGESRNESAEDIARGAEERAGRKGAADRPYAAGTGEETRGVRPQPSVTEGSPDLPPGDQGG